MDTRYGIAGGAISAVVSTAGAELTSIKDKHGRERLWSGDPAFWSSQAPILFPVVGGLHDDRYTFDGKTYAMGKHGFARHSEFFLAHKTDSSITMRMTENEHTLAQYPFKFEFDAIFTAEENHLKIVYEVKNHSKKPMPFQVGAHEAYACPEGIESYEIVFDRPETLHRYNLDGNFLNWSTIPYLSRETILPLKNDDFKADAIVFLNAASDTVTLRKKNGKDQLSVSFPDFETLMFWTKPGAPYICVEPWAGAADFIDGSHELAKRHRIQVLAPGEKYTREHIITIHDN